jgi:GDP-L-fucose synthase
LVIKFVRAVKDNLPEIEVWGTGKPIREWLYVKDFAAFARRVVQMRDFGADLVNIAQNRGYTVIELVEALKGLTNYQGKITYNTRYQDGSPKKVMDDRLFRQRFPDFAFTSLGNGLGETVDYYRRIL